jgi:hypothetical protein
MITGVFQAIPYWYLMWNYWKFSKPTGSSNDSFKLKSTIFCT